MQKPIKKQIENSIIFWVVCSFPCFSHHRHYHHALEFRRTRVALSCLRLFHILFFLPFQIFFQKNQSINQSK
jgi:hypothetical protein